MIRVIIADDHPVVRAGMKLVLSEFGDILVTAEMGSGEALIKEVQENDYDVVLLDITMPGIGGLETLKRLKALKPELPVLMLSVHSEDQFALRTMKAGAAGYLTKESAPAELVKAIRQVVGAQYSARLFGKTGHGAAPGHKPAPARAAFGPGDAGALHDGGRQDGFRHCRGAQPQRQNHQHLPCPDHRKDGHDHQCRIDRLRREEQPLLTGRYCRRRSSRREACGGVSLSAARPRFVGFSPTANSDSIRFLIPPISRQSSWVSRFFPSLRF